MKRRLIALLLCIAMIGSMTVYAVGDDPVCTCGTETEEHAAECALLAEPAPEPETDPVCTCGTETEEHTAECALYVAPAPVEPASNETETKSTGPAVGDKIWINSGSNVYKNMNDKHSHSLWGNYEVKIEEIVYDDNGAPAWYRFSFTSFGVGEAVLHSYKYVKVENTSVTNPEQPSEPEDPRACTCGEAAQENLAYHMDSCPRKQYVKSLFEGKTAEEIYASWDAYDDGIRIDLLNMLQVWDEAKWLELKYLVDTQPDVEPGPEQEVSAGEFDVVVAGVPEGISLNASVVEKDQFNEEIYNHIDANTEILYAFDINLTSDAGFEWQPADGKSVTVTLDFNGAGLADGNMINVIHDHNGELVELGAFEIKEGKLTFNTDGFSTFYFTITYHFGGNTITMSGMSEVYLSSILSDLGIDRTVADVTDVQFSNEKYIEVKKVGNDWLLTSVSNFNTEETLTIIFNDGEVIEIAVTDPVVYNYAVGSDITKVPLLSVAPHTVASVNDGDVTALNKTFNVNTAQITVDNVKDAGKAPTSAKPNENPDDAVDMIIYASEGMAIDFIGGTDWKEPGARPKYSDGEIWYWAWESAESANYVIIKDGATGKQAKFTVTTTKDNTKYYCDVLLCVVGNSNPTLLQGNLPAGYSLKNVPVTLYNYDGKAWNEHYNQNSGNYFAFASTVLGQNTVENAGNRGWTGSGLQANGGGGVALMGIVKNQLVNGLPEMAQGQKVDLFSTNAVAGKTVYPNVNFQFVYNENTGYYTYNSALNHAQFNSSNNTIELYKQSLGPSDTPNGASHGDGGFYPFEDIHKAYTNTGYTPMSEEEWKTNLEENAFKLIPAQYSTDIVTTSSTNPASTVDMHYGIQVASDFYLPKGKQLNDQDMVYEFTGDDDLWVFIDGKLVLDIGGGHTYVSGSFNLTTGEVWVEKYTQLAAADGGSYATRVQGTDLRYTDEFLAGLQDDQMHTIQIFYLERHSGVSNCRMRFNLPLVPSDAVNISKNVVNQDGNDLTIMPDVSYTFAIYTAADSDDNADATGFAAFANKDYTVTGSGAPTDTQKTDANGQFTLKDGWIASFQGIPRFTNVYVVETEPNDGYVYTESLVSVNKADAADYKYGEKTETKVMQLNSSINFDFINKMETQPLTIEKEVTGGADGLLNPNQEFAFDLVFTKDCVTIPSVETTGAMSSVSFEDKNSNADIVHLGTTLKLKQGEQVTIPNIPVNMTFTLSESNPDAVNNSFDAPTFTSTVCTTSDTPNAFDTAYAWTICDGANKVKVTNLQRFNLMISKSGFESVDHDGVARNDEEKQSAIFKVTGPNGYTTKVVVCGNNSTTIKELPVGKYTVEEVESWSWRYKANKNPKTVDPNVFTEEVDFENDREITKWLSGDNWIRNLLSMNQANS